MGHYRHHRRLRTVISKIKPRLKRVDSEGPEQHADRKTKVWRRKRKRERRRQQRGDGWCTFAHERPSKGLSVDTHILLFLFLLLRRRPHRLPMVGDLNRVAHVISLARSIPRPPRRV